MFGRRCCWFQLSALPPGGGPAEAPGAPAPQCCCWGQKATREASSTWLKMAGQDPEKANRRIRAKTNRKRAQDTAGIGCFPTTLNQDKVSVNTIPFF